MKELIKAAAIAALLALPTPSAAMCSGDAGQTCDDTFGTPIGGTSGGGQGGSDVDAGGFLMVLVLIIALALVPENNKTQ